MAKKRVTSKISIKDILKGKFLVEESAVSNWSLMVFLVVLALIMITSAHLMDNKVVTLEQQKEKLNEVKAKYALIQSRLIEMQLESELACQVEQDSLVALEDHPIKIIVE